VEPTSARRALASWINAALSDFKPKTPFHSRGQHFHFSIFFVETCRLMVGHRDSKTYFTIHQDNLRKWFLRLGADRKPMWVALRHVKPEEARRLAPGVELLEGTQFGDCRFALNSISDLQKVRTAIIAAYEREAARVSEDASAEPTEA
jgi:hypothetical protein